MQHTYTSRTPFSQRRIKFLGFTLVELIIVITIIAILGTLGFLAFTNYAQNSRDSKRMSEVATLLKGLAVEKEAYSGLYPLPDDALSISGSGTLLISQGNTGNNITRILKYSGDATDPTDNTPYTYTTNANRTKAQITTFLEKQNTLHGSIYNSTNDRYLYTVGDPVGTLLDSTTSLPIHHTTTAPIDLDTTHATTPFTIIYSNDISDTNTGTTLITQIIHNQTTTGALIISDGAIGGGGGGGGTPSVTYPCPIGKGGPSCTIDVDYTDFECDTSGTLTEYIGDQNIDLVFPDICEDGSTITHIGDHAFDGLRFDSLVLPNTITHIGEYAFFESSITGPLIIPDSVTYIGDDVFAYNDFTSIHLGNSLTHIGCGFSENFQVTSLVIPDSVVGTICFGGLGGLENLTIGAGVTHIGNYAFNGAHLTSIIIPQGVVSIGYGAFANNQLTSVTLPDSVVSIGEQAFLNNQLTSVILGNNVEYIGESTFARSC